jgi:hypothetical protein
MAYDTYYGKHWVRKDGWLPTSKTYAQKNKKKYLKYFTLCAEEAIDIFLFEREGLLHRDKNQELQDVFICEKNGNVAQRILELVRPPLKEAIFIGKLESIINFEDDHHTFNIDPDNDEISRKSFGVREKLKNKEMHNRLLKSFPFDVINFDIVENMLRDTETPLLKALSKVFELQTNDNFLIFITAPIEDINPNLFANFKVALENNTASHSEIKTAFEEQFEKKEFNDIDTLNRIAIGFSKHIIIPFAQNFNWTCNHHGIFIYENNNNRKMMNVIVELTKGQNQTDYIQDIIKVINEMPTYMPYLEVYPTEIVEDLRSVIEYREELRNKNG